MEHYILNAFSFLLHILLTFLFYVLTYRMKNNRIGCLNRDKNSCLNMLEIVETRKKKNIQHIKKE